MTSVFSFCILTFFAQGAWGQKSTSLTTPPSDAQIVAILKAITISGRRSSEYAEKKTKDPEVKRFANQMVTDQTMMEKQIEDLLHKAEESEMSQTLKAGATKTLKRLKNLKGPKFDREYLNQEVGFQQLALDSLDQTLQPNAKNEKLKVLLQEIRPTIAEHLEHARQLQARLVDRKANSQVR